MALTLYFDGASKRNPGPAGYGFVIKDGDRVIETGHGPLGIATNNIAEYTGLIEGLKAVAALKPPQVMVHGDSDLVINQVFGKWKIKAPGLKPLNAQAKKLVETLSKTTKVTSRWIPREENTEADKQSNLGVDLNRSEDVDRT